MLTRKSRLFLSLTAATPVFFAACVDNTLTNPYADVAGTYQLTVFAGKSLPAVYTYQAGDPNFPSGGTIVWTDGTMLLNGNGSFVETNNFNFTPTGGATQSSSFISSGTFSVRGTDFTLSAPRTTQTPERHATGTLDLDTINYLEQNTDGSTSAFEYKR